MNEFKGTRGPWFFDEPSCKIKSLSSKIDIADTSNSYCEYGENKSNANLIAAAPDLLSALLGVIRVADRDTNEFFAAHAAIAKALGESK